MIVDGFLLFLSRKESIMKTKELSYISYRTLFTAFILLLAVFILLSPESYADEKASYLYITETDGGSSISVPSEATSGTGWNWDAENGVLTLNNYNGSMIEVPSGDITIELVGTNRVTIPTVGVASSACGINVKDGILTIQTANSDPDASLWVGNTNMKTSNQYNLAIYGYRGIWLESGSL